jgi:LPS-assembly lipoprotein
LTVSLSESIAVLAIDKAAFATRANLNLGGTYQLVRLSDSNEIISGTISTVASYNVLSSDYATLQAQANARELAVKDLSHILVDRLAVHFKTTAPDVQSSQQPSRQGTGRYNSGYPN